MCDPITLTALGGAVLATSLSVGSDLIKNEGIADANDDLADSLDAQYRLEAKMAEEQFILDQQNLRMQTLAEMEDAAAEGREQEMQVRQASATAEAAMSALNVQGGTSLRTLGAWEVRKAGVEDESDLAQERINKGFYMEEDEIQEKRLSHLQGAVVSHRAGWNPQAPTSGLGIGINAVQGAVSGARAGLSLGKGLDDAGLFDTKIKGLQPFEKSIASNELSLPGINK